jgi:hypothetical protein
MAERDYRYEYLRDQASPKAKKDRAARNRARREMGLHKGDGLEADHIRPLASHGSYNVRNVRVVTRHTNRTKGRKT